MKTPAFWQTDNWVSRLLLPVSFLYGFVTQARLRLKKPYHCGVKVICIGNITAGGVGKTPVAMRVAEHYLARGKKVFFVTRGYKGKLKNILVDLTKHTPRETGDEARLLASVAPTIISPKREAGAKMAVEMGAEIIIMDDGFQNPGLYKDESWLVFDGAVGIGNGRIIPAGPLREKLSVGEQRATRVLIMGEDKTGLAQQCTLPVFFGRLEPLALELATKKVLAFAGIGHPEKFYRTLETAGFQVAAHRDFEDHHQYSVVEIDALKKEAAAKGLALVTTEKDYVKLSPVMRGDGKEEEKGRIYCLRVQADIMGLVEEESRGAGSR